MDKNQKFMALGIICGVLKCQTVPTEFSVINEFIEWIKTKIEEEKHGK